LLSVIPIFNYFIFSSRFVEHETLTRTHTYLHALTVAACDTLSSVYFSHMKINVVRV